MEYAEKLWACLHCDRRANVGGAVRCGVDGGDLDTHAKAEYCPHPEGARYGDGRIPLTWTSRGLGDTIAKITSAVGIVPCEGCKKRQQAANRAAPY